MGNCVEPLVRIYRDKDKTLILSAQDILEIGEGTEIGSDYQDTILYIYAENILVNGAFRMKGGIISAHSISIGANGQIICSGENGSPGNSNQTNGTDGQDGGYLKLFLESPNPDAPAVVFISNGGNGGNGLSSIAGKSGGNGGNGGNGGDISVLVGNCYEDILEPFGVLYLSKQLSDDKERAFTSLLERCRTSCTIPECYFQESAILKSIDARILSFITYMETRICNYTNYLDLQVYKGFGGGGVKSGKDGASGNIEVHMLQSTKIAYIKFAYIHPVQLQMLLGRAERIYLGLNYQGGKEAEKKLLQLKELLDRIVKRTCFLESLEGIFACQIDTVLSESRATENLDACRTIRQRTYTLLDQLALGQDYFGWTLEQVPLASCDFYQKSLKTAIDNYTHIETLYESYQKEFDQKEKRIEHLELCRQQAYMVVMNANKKQAEIEKMLADLLSSLNKAVEEEKELRTSLWKALNKLEKSIKEKVSINPETLLSAMAMLTFAPKSGFMWASQLGEIGIDLLNNVHDDQSYRISKDYLVRKVKTLQGGLTELATYMTEDARYLDDNEEKVLMLEEQLNIDLEKYYQEFSYEASNISEKFNAYKEGATIKNQQIINYNQLLKMLSKIKEDRSEANISISQWSKEALKEASFPMAQYMDNMSVLRRYFQESILEIFHNVIKACSFWGLEDTSDLMAQIFGQYANVGITEELFKTGEQYVMMRYNRMIEQFGNEASLFPASNLVKGVVHHLTKEQVERLKQRNTVTFKIPIADYYTTMEENSFAGRACCRVREVRVWVEGVQTKDNYLAVNIIRMGDDPIVNVDNEVMNFKHVMRDTFFKYNLIDKTVQDKGNLGWDDIHVQSDKKIYALFGPFGRWKIQIDEKWNLGLDLPNISSVELEFFGMSYPFKIK